ncbi:MAG TPA: hypothetical protein VGS96_08895 [Thermoanaerobaculia bacterium]|jgi:hypothetical protein|nr:hypothetical protein [Thermoanaerobaculia bacterium]
MIFLFLIITATFRPATPTVGDLITIDFQQPVALDPSPAYEVVSQHGRRVVVRTFEPKPFAISGLTGGVRFRNLTVPVRSVLKPKDKLDPAPLRPPVGLRFASLPFALIGIVVAIALLSWIGVILLARRREQIFEEQPLLDPAERFRKTIASLRDHPHRWAALADATRLYLSSLSPHFGVDLTTSQLLPRVDAQHVAVIAQILRQGDLEKFSPWGAPAADFDAIAARALELIPVPREFDEEAAA